MQLGGAAGWCSWHSLPPAALLTSQSRALYHAPCPNHLITLAGLLASRAERKTLVLDLEQSQAQLVEALQQAAKVRSWAVARFGNVECQWSECQYTGTMSSMPLAWPPACLPSARLLQGTPVGNEAKKRLPEVEGSLRWVSDSGC